MELSTKQLLSENDKERLGGECGRDKTGVSSNKNGEKCDQNVKGGLTSKESMRKLQHDLEALLSRHQSKTPALSWAFTAWKLSSTHGLARLTSVFLGMVLAFALLALGPEATAGELASAVVLLVLIAATVLLVLWEAYLRCREVELRVARVAALVGEVAEAESRWQSMDYPHLHTPPSASLVLQWTMRDGYLVNLPWALLVKGDLVVLREGQPAPGLCSAREGDLRLERGEVLEQQSKADVPRLKPAKEPRQFLLEETPCILEIEAVLEQAGKRPVSQLEKQRIFFISTILELVLLPTTLVLVLVWNCLRRQLLPSLSLLPIIPTDPVGDPVHP